MRALGTAAFMLASPSTCNLGEPHSRYKRNSRLSLTTKPRLRNPSTRDGRRVFRSRASVYTTNSSLPGLYSHRSRRLLLQRSLLELYCTRPLKNIRGLNA